MSEENILTDPNSPGWRYLRDTEQIQPGDEFLNSECMWCLTNRVGEIADRQVTYRRRIEQQPQATPDDPSDDRYWRNVLPSEILQPDDMMRTMTGLWLRTTVPGKFARDGCGRTYRRRIEQPQPSDSDNVAELTVKQPAPPLPDRQPDSRPTSPPPPRKRADTDAPEWRIQTLQNMLNATCETLSRRVQDLQRENTELQAAVAQVRTSLQATVTLEPEWAADIDKFFVSRDAGIRYILRTYYRRAAEIKTEQ